MTTTNEVNITEVKTTETAMLVEATCGSVSALVVITDHNVQIICQNASNQAWRGAGRFFPTIQDALNAYKKAEMKAIIAAADSCNH